MAPGFLRSLLFPWTLLGVSALLLSSEEAAGQQPRDTVVEVSANVQLAPAQISLTWKASSFPITLQKVFRRLKGESAWVDVATPANGELSYTDEEVVVGASYEYLIYRSLDAAEPAYAAGYLSAGIRLPLVERRGRVILLVDATMSAPLEVELSRFMADLQGDGWEVARQDVSRSLPVPAVKALVQSLHAQQPSSTRALILFGHIPVPYSGELAPDGHPDHRGAWPADVYYADLDGAWTDSVVNNEGPARSENRNVPGDGKFDQSSLPSSLELEVGRIDLAGMESVSNGLTEAALLRQYLDRNHAFRHQLGAFRFHPPARIDRRQLRLLWR